MRLHRFFVHCDLSSPKTTSSVLVIQFPEQIHQWKKVFRFVPGDTIIVFDGSGVECTAQFSYLDKNEARLVILQRYFPDTEASRPVYLFASLTKKDTFEIIAQKPTELGVCEIFPVISARSEKKDINFDRLHKIIIEATEQSGRVKVPQIHKPLDFKDIFLTYDQAQHGNMLVWEPRGVPFARDNDICKGSISMAIGPEGGWTPEELENFQEKGALIRSSGKTILRADTASIALLSLVILPQ